MTSLGRTASSLHHNSVLGHKSLTPKGNPLSRVSHPPPRIPLPCQGPNPLPGDTMGLRAPPPRGPQKAGSFKRAWPHVTAVTHPTEGGQERAGGGGGRLPPNAWSLLIGHRAQPMGSGHLGRQRSGAPSPPASGRPANGSGPCAGAGQWTGAGGGPRGGGHIKSGAATAPLRSAGRRRAGRERATGLRCVGLPP